jgi:hypothetical protein
MRYRDLLNAEVEVDVVQWTGDREDFQVNCPTPDWEWGTAYSGVPPMVRGRIVPMNRYVVVYARPARVDQIQFMEPGMFNATYEQVPE